MQRCKATSVSKVAAITCAATAVHHKVCSIYGFLGVFFVEVYAYERVLETSRCWAVSEVLTIRFYAITPATQLVSAQLCDFNDFGKACVPIASEVIERHLFRAGMVWNEAARCMYRILSVQSLSRRAPTKNTTCA